MALGWLCDSTLKTTAIPSPMSSAPAFSPGPTSTRAPFVGSRARRARECLYAQCSDHIAPNMPSSTSFGWRPSASTTRSNSLAVSPWSRSGVSATVMGATGSCLLPPERLVATELDQDGADRRGGGTQEEQQRSDSGRPAEAQPVERNPEAHERYDEDGQAQVGEPWNVVREEDGGRHAEHEDQEQDVGEVHDGGEQVDQRPDSGEERPTPDQPGGQHDRPCDRQVHLWAGTGRRLGAGRRWVL